MSNDDIMHFLVSHRVLSTCTLANVGMMAATATGPDSGVRDKSSASVSDPQGGAAPAVENMLQLPESKDPEDTSAGLLRYGGSTSGLRVSLTTDDDTADYTVGGGLLWVAEAEVVGIPEEWKVQPPPDLEHVARNDAIAQLLAGESGPSIYVPCLTRKERCMLATGG